MSTKLNPSCSRTQSTAPAAAVFSRVVMVMACLMTEELEHYADGTPVSVPA